MLTKKIIMDFVVNEETILLGFVLSFIWLHFLWETYLKYRQERFYIAHEQQPELVKDMFDEFTYQVSLAYQRARLWLGYRHTIFLHIQSTLIVVFSGIEFLWNQSGALVAYFGYGADYEILQSLVYAIAQELFFAVTSLPWMLISLFVIDAKFGFYVQVIAEEVVMGVLAAALLLVLALPLFALTLYVIKTGGAYFFLWAWVFLLVSSLLLTFVRYDMIRYGMRPLPAGLLRTQIEQLTSNVGFPFERIFVYEGSSQVNAYVHGFKASTSIVLYDQLLARRRRSPWSSVYTNDEVLAVVAHEIGHWTHSHIAKLFVILQLTVLVELCTYALLMTSPFIYTAFGFAASTQPTVIGLVVICGFILRPYRAMVKFLMTSLGQRFEYQADEFAVTLTEAANLRSALIKLHHDNLTFPMSDWLYSRWYHSHPPLLDRIVALQRYN